MANIFQQNIFEHFSMMLIIWTTLQTEQDFITVTSMALVWWIPGDWLISPRYVWLHLCFVCMYEAVRFHVDFMPSRMISNWFGLRQCRVFLVSYTGKQYGQQITAICHVTSSPKGVDENEQCSILWTSLTSVTVLKYHCFKSDAAQEIARTTLALKRATFWVS